MMQRKTDKIDVTISIDRDLDRRIKNEILPHMPSSAFFSKAIELGLKTFRALPFDPDTERMVVEVYTINRERGAENDAN
jgi:hypothetical protein